MSADSWMKGALGNSAQYYNPDYPDWQIYDKAAGFFVWQEFRYLGRYDSFDDAEAAVKAAS